MTEQTEQTETGGEVLTPEETTALADMQADNEPVQEQVEQPKAETAETAEAAEAKEGDPEFKTTRKEKPPEGFVPHEAMHAERVKRQDLEKQVQELAAWKASQEAAKAEQPPQYVDPLEDPEGFRRYNEYHLNKTDAALKQREAQTAAETAFRAKQARVVGYEKTFIEKTADYPQASKFLMDARVAELRAQGYGDDDIKATISRDTHALIDAAEAIGMNPAHLAYLRAQERGYQKSAPAQGDADKLTAIAAAQKATQGLGDGAGAQAGKLTATQIAAMSEDEFNKLSDEDVRVAMGG